MRSAVIGFVGLFFSGLFPGCGESSSYSNEGEHSPEIRTEAQQLSGDAARLLVVQEASYAMTGDYNAYMRNPWPTGTTLARYGYTSSGIWAWNALKSAYGISVSCKGANYSYPPCAITRGANEMPQYTCQGSCNASSKMRGGQCKAFMNLIGYRSGQYINNDGSFKSFKSDKDIRKASYAEDQMPVATYQNIKEGDFLRMPDDHALIVVRKIDPRNVVVFDSNWVGGGNGEEVVGSHVLGFSGDGRNNLGSYRVLKCAYNGNC